MGEQPCLPHSLFLGDRRWLHTDLAPHSSHLCPGPCLHPGRSRSCEKGAMFQLQSRTGWSVHYSLAAPGSGTLDRWFAVSEFASPDYKVEMELPVSQGHATGRTKWRRKCSFLRSKCL